LLELGSLAGIWMLAKLCEGARSAPEPWPDPWKRFAKIGGFELSSSHLIGAVDGVPITLRVAFASEAWSRGRNEACTEVEVEATRIAKLEPAHVAPTGAGDLPEHVREALAKLGCRYELRSAASTVSIVLDAPSFDDVEAAIVAIKLLARRCTALTTAYR
jgi:hypothetical protein